jgi:hypothetical protein
MKILFVPHREHFASSRKNDRYNYSDNHMKHTKTLRGQNGEFLVLKLAVYVLTTRLLIG